MCARVAFDKPVRSARNTSPLTRSHDAPGRLDRAPRTSGCRRLDVRTRQTEAIRFVSRPRWNGRRRNRHCCYGVTFRRVPRNEIVCRPLQCNRQYPSPPDGLFFNEISLLWRESDRDYLRYYSATARRERIFGRNARGISTSAVRSTRPLSCQKKKKRLGETLIA